MNGPVATAGSMFNLVKSNGSNVPTVAAEITVTHNDSPMVMPRI